MVTSRTITSVLPRDATTMPSGETPWASVVSPSPAPGAEDTPCDSDEEQCRRRNYKGLVKSLHRSLPTLARASCPFLALDVLEVEPARFNKGGVHRRAPMPARVTNIRRRRS